MSAPLALQTIGLTKKYETLTALDGLDIELPYGTIYALLGPNGAGKTTAVKVMAGILKPTAGSVIVNEFAVQAHPMEAKRCVGYISDQPFVYEYLSGWEFMRFIGDIYRVAAAEQRKRIPELLELFELARWSDELIGSYSHGMKQKLVIASALLHDPDVLILDEPLVGLDPKSARLVKDIFVELARRKKSIFMCTHVLEIAERLAHTVGILHHGKLIAAGSVPELKQQCSSQNTLEEVFLEVTGGSHYSTLLQYL